MSIEPLTLNYNLALGSLWVRPSPFARTLHESCTPSNLKLASPHPSNSSRTQNGRHLFDNLDVMEVAHALLFGVFASMVPLKLGSTPWNRLEAKTRNLAPDLM